MSSESSSATMASPSPSSPPRPQLQKGTHKFWSPEIQKFRLIYLKPIIVISTLTVLVMWAALPVYWGSLAHQRTYSNKLKVDFINRDGGDVGNAIQAVIEANIKNTTHMKLGWRIETDKYPTDHEAINGMLNEHSWMTVIIPANTTQNLIAARASGDKTWDPTHAIEVYYSQGRNEMAANNYLVPYSELLLGNAATAFGQKYTAAFLAANAANSTLLSLAAQAPQTLSTPVWYTMNNLRPFSATVATALLLVGAIYIIIFTFVVSMAGVQTRAPIEPFLSTRELLQLRILAPLIIYVVLSFSYAMIGLAFKPPFDAHFSYGGGFFVWWIYIYMTMAALGLSVEFAMQILGPKFMAFFLLPLIIINVSVAQLPISLEPWFFHYGYAFPIYNMSIATRTILFNTYNHLGRNAAILLAWIVLSIINLTLITLFQRRRAAKKARVEAEKKLEEGTVEKVGA